MTNQQWHNFSGFSGFSGFNKTLMPQTFFIEPTTDKAREFINKYGQVFTVRDSNKNQCTMTLETGYNELIKIEKTDQGIIVEGEFFTKDWTY